LKQIIVERRSLPIAQMWIRDHIIFAFAPLQAFLPNFDSESFEFDPIGPPPNAGAALTRIEHTLVEILQPWLNTSPTWAKLGGTCHEDHDITMPITPRAPLHQWASEQDYSGPKSAQGQSPKLVETESADVSSRLEGVSGHGP
jgi:hypothetical protein